MEQADFEKQAEIGEVPLIRPIESLRLAIGRRQAEEGELWSVLCDNVQHGLMSTLQAETAYQEFLHRP